MDRNPSARRARRPGRRTRGGHGTDHCRRRARSSLPVRGAAWRRAATGTSSWTAPWMRA